MRQMIFKAVIFDMDGTLIHSTEADFQAWKRVCADYGIPLTYELYFPLLGMKSVDFIALYMKADPSLYDRILQEKARHFDNFVAENGIELITGVVDLLERLKSSGIKIGLATSSRRYKADTVLGRLNIQHYFDAITTGEEVHKSKPAPDIFQLAARRLGVPCEACIVFEDAANGVAAAKKAGCYTVAITSTHTSEQLSQADLVINAYQEFNLNMVPSYL